MNIVNDMEGGAWGWSQNNTISLAWGKLVIKKCQSENSHY